MLHVPHHLPAPRVDSLFTAQPGQWAVVLAPRVLEGRRWRRSRRSTAGASWTSRTGATRSAGLDRSKPELSLPKRIRFASEKGRGTARVRIAGTDRLYTLLTAVSCDDMVEHQNLGSSRFIIQLRSNSINII